MDISPHVIVLDIDHTLLHLEPAPIQLVGESLYLHPRTQELIVEAQRRGIATVLATGRRLSRCLTVARTLAVDWSICEHGGLVVDQRGAIDRAWVGQLAPWIGRWEQLGRQLGLLWDYQRQLEAEGFATTDEGRYASFRIDPSTAKLDEPDVRLLQERRHPPGITTTRNLQFLDFLPALGGKKNALRYLLERLQLTAKETAMIGDDVNDRELLECVGLPCTLAGARPEIIALVNRRGGIVSAHPQHAGIQTILEHLLGSQPFTR